MTTTGLHHITAICGSAANHVAFYRDVLGLRLVKRTVNFDDPGTWHLYYGDAGGNPGSILTFFPFPGASAGVSGSGMAGETAFLIPKQAVQFWVDRFMDLGIAFDEPTLRFGSRSLTFRDPDGLPLSLIEEAASVTPQPAPWTGSDVPEGSAIAKFSGVTLHSGRPDATARLITEVFGYREVGVEDARTRFQLPEAGSGGIIDLLASENRSRPGSGTVHHVAFRARDAADQLAWRDTIQEFGLSVTDVKDRQYFRSIYFREPGGVLFEIATDPPGFMIDESEAELGTSLRLPPWLEGQRARIASQLEPLPGGSA